MVSQSSWYLHLASFMILQQASAVRLIESTFCPSGLLEACNDAFQTVTQCYDSSPWSTATSDAKRSEAMQFSLDLTVAISDPVKIDQGNQAFCGPAAFLYVLAVTSPDRYLDLATSLFCSGAWKDPVSKIKIDPHPNIVKEFFGFNSIFDYEKPESLQMRDWITEASLKTSSNLIHTTGNRESFKQLTFPGTMNSWIPMLGAKSEQVGSYAGFIAGAVIGETKLGTTNAMKVVNAVKNSAGQVLAIVLMGWQASFPNHWVVLQNVVESREGDTCMIKTWGRIVSMPCSDLMQRMYCVFILDFEGKLGEDRVAILQQTVATSGR
jgi:hypothetical protein